MNQFTPKWLKRLDDSSYIAIVADETGRLGIMASPDGIIWTTQTGEAEAAALALFAQELGEERIMS